MTYINDIEFKKTYNFFWQLSPEQTTIVNGVMGLTNTQKLSQLANIPQKIAEFKNIITSGNVNKIYNTVRAITETAESKAMMYAMFYAFMDKISPLAKSVNIPDDEIITEDYQVGITTFKVPKGVRMGDIIVTYIDDNFDDVWKFHKMWQNCIRNMTSMSFNDIPSFSACARFVSTDKSLTSDEFLEYVSLNDSQKSKYLESIEKEPVTSTNYPRLFPIKVNRTVFDKSGSNISEVTVTYTRSPLLTKSPNCTII